MDVATGSISKVHLFLSYRSVEVKFADVLKEHLVRDFIGLVEVFLASDTTSIPAGSHWLAQVHNGLQRSQLHIIICSSQSVACPWIHYEAGAAGVRGIPIVPLCHSKLVPEQLPVPLSECQGGVITQASGLQNLYARIADLIGSAIPDVDFEAYAAEFKTVEASSAIALEGQVTDSPKAELIKKPRVLCVTSPQFRELGSANQLQIVLDAFPKDMKHQVALNSSDLKEILMVERVDIIHIAAFVCPRGGDLYFSPVELPLGKSASEDRDILSADALVALVEKANTRLVVLGASASLVLAAQLLPVTNVIAARDMISAKAMASWVETFYSALMRVPLAEANKLASDVSQASMKLYAQQRDEPSMTVQVGAV